MGSLAVTPTRVWACSCDWRGPFFQVAPQAPLILIGDIVRHEAGPPPALVVWVRGADGRWRFAAWQSTPVA